YIGLYCPSPAFIHAWDQNIEYMAASEYYSFKENNKYGIWTAYKRNKNEWQHVQDSLFSHLNLDNQTAVSSLSYRSLLKAILVRTKESLWDESGKHPATFYRDWYDTTEAAGAVMHQKDPENLLQEKIILRYFKSPAVVDYQYAVLLDDALSERNPTNLIQIYQRFKRRFPHSPYLRWIEPAMRTVAAHEQRRLNAKMVFAPENGAKLHSWEDVLTLVKGKTVLLDMWGTWCGPCRQQIEKNNKAIHDHFKGKGLDYLYIASYDEQRPDVWKKMIAYFNLEGTHVLANKDLTKDVLAKVKGTGFPTYVVIKRDGTFALSKAGFPMKREMLIQQLEEALAK
ncbi:MAG TPA: TlpA disulfide reductase family protein, partial [Puia sp.]|nr:TlpA disulfide reductase family protein [Puia sp.]